MKLDVEMMRDNVGRRKKEIWKLYRHDLEKDWKFIAINRDSRTQK